ncbi:filamentous hemagglutinin family protein [Oxalobacteraceae bacterium GrIS 2.11]
MQKQGSLNRIYRLVWSQVTNSWVAVAETAKGKGKGKSQRRKLIATALALAAINGAIPAAMAVNVAANLPVLNPTIKGSGSVVVTSGAVGMTITQATQNALLNWNSFNVGEHNFVNFVQPNASSVTVNNILDNNPSTILGSVHANGSIFLINPNGMVFGPHARVNVGGLVVSALAMNGSGSAYKFSGSGSVDNQGTINAGSYVVLLGSSVTNEGTITAPLGNIILGAGNQATMKLNSSTGTVSLNIDKSTLKNLVANGGVIIADGGHIIMTAGARNELVASAVNNNGVLQARTVGVNKGTISLLADKEGGALGGTVTVGGTIDASAPDGGDGGAVETSAGAVKMAPQFAVLTHAGKGRHGNWLIDPVDFNIGNNNTGNGETSDITGTDLGNALANSDITIQTSGSPPCTNVSCGSGSGSLGDINVNEAVSWSSGHALTLNADNNINVYRPISVNGAGTLNLWYGQQSAAGSGALNIYSPINLASNSTITTQLGSNPANLINNYQIINGLGAQGSTTGNDLQGINGNLTGNYVLGSDIDASVTASWSGGFVPVGATGNSATEFTGIFNGLGHSISGLTISQPISNSSGTGLFGATGPLTPISNVTLVNSAVSGGTNVGTLIGFADGSIINNCSATQTVTDTTVSGYNQIGGLIGQSASATITNSSASVNVSVNATFSGSSNAGGLVGRASSSTFQNDSASGSVQGIGNFGVTGGLVGSSYGGHILNSSTTAGMVSNYGFAGGLVGRLFGTSIDSSMSSENVTSGRGPGGGLIGVNYGGTISNSSASGNVTASQGPVGGLIGQDNSGMVSNSFATGIVTGVGTVGGLIGVASNTTITNDSLALSISQPTSATVTGVHDVGGLIGDDSGATISNTKVTGAVNGTVIGATNGSYNIGGLVGFTYGSSTISNSLSTGPVTAPRFSGADYGNRVGGLVGYAGSGTTIMSSSSSGNVEGNTSVGGLVGQNDGTITLNSHASGTVTGLSTVGGLVGQNNGTINQNSYASGMVNGVSTVGGLVGQNNGTIDSSYATGAVTSSGAQVTGLDSNAGGLVGSNSNNLTASNGIINNSYATGAVVADSNKVGGLIGVDNGGQISNSYASGNVTVTAGISTFPARAVGGLIGATYGSNISNSHSSAGTVTASNGSWVGGLVGVTDSSTSITNSYSTENVSGVFTSSGGLVGRNSGIISISYATGDVSGYSSTVNGFSYGAILMGGLVGINFGQIGQSFAFGRVSGSSYIGGFAGTNRGDISDSYATGSVTASGGTQSRSGYSAGNSIGGFVGFNGDNSGVKSTGTINNSYSTGLVTTGADASNVGGLIGYNVNQTPNAISNSYWNVDSSGQQMSPAGGSALQNADMTNSAKFFLWDFGNNWYVDASQTGPVLQAFMTKITIAADPVNTTYNGSAYTGAKVTPTLVNGIPLVGTPVFSYTDASNAPVSPKDVGTYSILTSGYQSSQLGYLITYAPAPLMINPYRLTLTSFGTAVSKTYDGTNTATINGADFNHTQLFGTDQVNMNATGTFVSPDASPNLITVTPTYGLTGAQAADYIVAPAKHPPLTAHINQAQLTVTGETASSKTYDGTTTASLSNGKLSGLVGADSGLVTLTEAGNFVGSNAGPSVGVVTSDSISGTTSTGAPATTDYMLVQPSMALPNPPGPTITAAINPVQLTVAGQQSIPKVADGTTSVTFVAGSGKLNTVLPVDLANVVLNQSGYFSNNRVLPGSGLPITVTDTLTLTGSAIGNYTLIEPTDVTGTINPASTLIPVSIIGQTVVASKTYDGKNTAKVTGGTLSCLPGCTGLTLIDSGTFNSTDAGTGIAVTVNDKLGGTNAAKYYIVAEPTGVTGTINPKGVTISGLKGTGFVFNNSVLDPLSGTPVVNGLISGQSLTVTNADGTLALDGTLAAATAGSEPITTNLKLADSNNPLKPGLASDYFLTAQPKLANVTISPELVKITPSGPYAKVYDGTTAAAGTAMIYLVSGVPQGTLYNGDLLSGGVFAYANANAGTGKTLTVSGVTLNNPADLIDYKFSYVSNTTSSITPAPLYYVANSVLMPLGGPLPTLSGTVTGFIGGASLDAEIAAGLITGTGKWTTTATVKSAAGYYPIKGSGYSLKTGNYKLFQAPGNAEALCVSVACPYSPQPQFVTPVNAAPLTQATGTITKTNMRGVQIRDGGVKMPTDMTAMN